MMICPENRTKRVIASLHRDCSYSFLTCFMSSVTILQRCLHLRWIISGEAIFWLWIFSFSRIYYRVVLLVHCDPFYKALEAGDHNDFQLVNDNFLGLWACSTDYNEANNLLKIHFFSSLFLFLARFAFHRRRIIFSRQVMTTNWCWQICRATWRCRFHQSSSLNTATKSSQAVGIRPTSHSCQPQLIKRRDCGRFRQFKRRWLRVHLKLFPRAKISALFVTFSFVDIGKLDQNDLWTEKCLIVS